MMQKQLEDVFASVHKGNLDIEDAINQIRLLKEKHEPASSSIPPPVMGKEEEILQFDTDLPRKIQEYLVSKLQKCTQNLLKISSIEKNVMDLGLDSIQLTELTLEIETETGIELHPTLFFEYPNIKELADFFAQEHPAAFKKGFNVTSASTEIIHSPVESHAPVIVGDQPAEIQEIPLPHLQAKSTNGQTKTTPQPSLSNPLQVKTDPALPNDDIAIIGMDGLFAESSNLDQFWQNIMQQKNLIREIPPERFDVQQWYNPDPEAEDSIYCKWGSFIDDVDKFDARFFGISPHEADWMDPQLRLLLQSIYATSQDAGYAAKMRGSNTGVFVGVCYQDYKESIIDSGWPMNPYLGTGNSYAVLANRASFVFDFSGPSIPIDTACSSSLFALHSASTALRNQDCDMAFVVGVNLILSPFRYRYFCNIGALSHTGRCHTFDAAADGYVPGEAITSVLLKPLWKAEQDGDRIHAIIKGSAALHGGYTPSLTAPSVKGETNVILKAWENANIDPTTLSYIEAHGTGTALGDPVEINALKKAFAHYTNEDDFCAIGSAKAHIGHTEGAAGLAGLLKVVLQMQHGQIPSMPEFNEQNPYIKLEDSPLYINREPIPWESKGTPRRAGVSSFGFSGSYAHVVIEEYLHRLNPFKMTPSVQSSSPCQPEMKVICIAWLRICWRS